VTRCPIRITSPKAMAGINWAEDFELGARLTALLGP
jgi:hypothetical protein